MPPKKTQSTAWKGAEKQIAQILRDFGVPAERMSRAANWSQKDYEVHVEGTGHFLKIDSKYTQAKPFRHHSLMREIQFKYCKSPGDEAVLFTKNYKEHSGFVTIRAEFFAELVAALLKEKESNGRN